MTKKGLPELFLSLQIDKFQNKSFRYIYSNFARRNYKHNTSALGLRTGIVLKKL